ncbi:hypothetical protein DW215_21860 [Parabacteroides sp. AM18-12LB]|nr:hypothetical protein DW215_21860 [Parabacteroides sp. AM18-12LB]
MKEDEDKIPRIGVSAQAVREVLPEAVQLITPDNGDSYYGVDYIQMLTASGSTESRSFTPRSRHLRRGWKSWRTDRKYYKPLSGAGK